MDLKFIQIGAGPANILGEAVWIIIGLITIFAGIKNLLDKENPSRIGTAVFWCSFGVVCAFGTWLPAKVSGALVIVMCMPPIFKRVKVGKTNAPTKEYTKSQYAKIGMKIFIPALTVAVCSYFHADPESLFPGQQAEGISGRFRTVPFYDGSSVYASSAPWGAGWNFHSSRCW